MSDAPGLLRFGDHTFSAPDLRLLLDAVAEGITVQDPSGRLVYANPAAVLILGFETPERLVATPPEEVMRAFELFDEDGRPLAPENLPGQHALSDAEETERLVRFRVIATGEERWSMVKARPAFAPDGSVRYAINVWQDVTDRVSKEQFLEQNSQQLQEITAELEATVDELQKRTEEAEAAQQRAEYVADRQRFLAEAGRLLAASLDPRETLRVITHLAVPRIADWCTVSLINEQGQAQQLEVAHADPDKLQFALELQKRYPPDNSAALRIQRSGESELYAEIPESLIAQGARDPQHLRILQELQLRSAMVVPMKIRGRVIGLISFLRAESGSSYDQDDLEFAESLAARSALALSNARLYAEAQEANAAKADFLAVMSHELRTPLTAIFGYTELLATGVSGTVTPAQQDQLGRIRASAAHLLGIIEDILSFARTEAGREEVREDAFRLSTVVAEAVDQVRPAAAKKHLGLDDWIERDCALRTDRGKLRQILLNLLSNAVKFTDDGRIMLTATCDDTWAVVTVSDTGAGIEPADLERIFEPFRQLQRATTRTAGGTGLGLAVARRFATLLGGSLGVSSQPGNGSEFTLRIPVSG